MNDLHHQIAHSHLDRSRRRLGPSWLRRHGPTLRSNIITRLRASFDDAPVLPADGTPASIVAMLTFCCWLQRRTDGHPITRTQRAVLDQFGNPQRNLLVERVLAVQQGGGMGGKVRCLHVSL